MREFDNLEHEPVGAVAGYFPEILESHPMRAPRRDFVMRGEYGTRHAVDGRKRCPQCWKVKAFPEEFDGRHNCNDCRPTSRRGFASMPPERLAEVASMGGKAAQKTPGGQHRFTSEEAREAGRKGGLAKARNSAIDGVLAEEIDG